MKLITLLLIAFTFESFTYDCQNGQCIEILNSGYRCKNCTKEGSMYCSSHGSYDYNAPPSRNLGNRTTDCNKCLATNKEGKQCGNCQKTGSIYCGVHGM